MSFKSLIMGMLRSWYLKEGSLERISPNDWVGYDQILYDETTRTLKIGGLQPQVIVANVADTGSMDGLLDFGHNVILTDNFEKSKLAVGDIIAYQVYTNLVLHRIVEIGNDIQGRWYLTRGDNNIINDPYQLRDANLKYLLIGIIY